MMINRPALARAAALTALTALLVSGCATTAASPPEVTVTRTVLEPAVASAGPSAAISAPDDTVASRSADHHRPSSGDAPAASPAPEDPRSSNPPSTPASSGPRTTITMGRPTAHDPQRHGASTTTTGRADTGHGATGGSSSTARHSGTRPPGSLSTDGDLIAAATSAAAAAGVAPANPDTPGPASGPPCPANPSYVNEKPTGLRSDVITAWRRAVARAAAAGITMCLNDGKRSRAQQQAQYDQYVTEYGKDVADQLVLQPNKSAHVVGIAVDVQPATAYRWLQSTDGSLGFCRIYDNEAWHFEFNPAYRTTGCPARLPEPER